MPEDGKKAAIGLGIAGVIGLGIYALTREAEAGPLPGLAHLYGQVTDAQSGLVLPGVKVTLNGRQTQTNSGGNYQVLNLEPGQYSGTFEKAGYKTETV